MKIAFVTSYFGREIDGASQVIKELSSRLIKDGHEVHVYAPAWDKKKRIPAVDEDIDGIKVHRCFYFFKVANFATFWPGVFFKILKEKYDIVHTHVSGHPHVLQATIAAKIKKSKVIHTTHAPWTEGNRSFFGNLIKPLAYNIINRISYKLSDHIIAISEWEVPFIEKYGGNGKITVIPNGVDDLFFESVKNNKFKSTNKLKGNIVLFFGRLDPIKGPDKFLLAAKKILAFRKDITFLVVGPDEGMKKELLEIAGNSKNIVFMGAIKDRKKASELYQSADIFVLPSMREGSPLSLFEAMASKVPVIGSNVPGIKAIIKSENNGLLCEYGDVEGLAIAIIRLIDDKKLSKRISSNNYTLAKQFKWSSIYEKTISLYK